MCQAFARVEVGGEGAEELLGERLAVDHVGDLGVEAQRARIEVERAEEHDRAIDDRRLAVEREVHPTGRLREIEDARSGPGLHLVERNAELGYVAYDTYVRVETNVYSLPDERLVWASATRTANPKDVKGLVDDTVKAVKKAMRDQGLV
jgi:hypothetical protein